MDVDHAITTEAGNEPVELMLPVRARSAVVARLVAATLAADCAFDVDEIDDMRLAVDEAVGVAVDVAGAEPDARITVRFEPSEAALTVRVSTTASTSFDGASLDPLAARIMGAMVDRFAVLDGALVLDKRRGDRDGG